MTQEIENHTQTEFLADEDSPACIDELVPVKRGSHQRPFMQDQTLCETDEQFRTIFDKAAVGVAVISLQDGRIMTSNPALQEMLGYDADELATKTLVDITHPEDIEEDLSYVDDLVAGRIDHYHMEKRYITKDGSIIWGHLTSTIVLDINRKPLYGIGMVEDITERKVAEGYLKKYQMLSENSRDIVLFVRRDDGQIIEANDAAVRAYGYSRDELLSLNVRDLRTPEFTQQVEAQMAQADSSGILFETKHQRKDGSTFDVEVSARGTDMDGQRILLGIVRDITDRKQIDMRLKKESRAISVANAILELFVKESGDDLYDKALDVVLEAMESKHGVFGYINEQGDLVCPTMSRMLDQCEVEGKCIHYPCGKWKGRWADALSEKRTLYSNETSMVPTGHVSIKRNIAAPILFQGNVIGLLNLANKETNYTEEDREFIDAIAGRIAPVLYAWIQRSLRDNEQKRAEDALRESEQRLNRSQEIAHLGSWELDLIKNELTWSDEVYRIFGLKPQEFGATYEAFLERVHPDDRTVVDDAYTNSLRRGRDTYEIEHRIVRKSTGEIRWVQEKCEHARDANGSIVRSFGMVHDITERKEVEQEQKDLLRREQRIASMLQQALVPACVPEEINGYKVAATYKPALKEAEVGGDFYDIFDLGDGRVCILIGDVAGKGLQAAIRVAAARYAIRSYAFIETRPSRILTLANSSLCCTSDEERDMLTAFLAIIDTRVGTVVYSNAGHEPPLVLHADGTIKELPATGAPLGVLPDIIYSEDACKLDQGSRILMVTDGITEARAPGVVLFGKERVADYLHSNSASGLQDMVEGLLKAASAHAGGELQDDAAIVLIEKVR